MENYLYSFVRIKNNYGYQQQVPFHISAMLLFSFLLAYRPQIKKVLLHQILTLFSLHFLRKFILIVEFKQEFY